MIQVVGRVPGVLKLTGKGADKEKVMYGEKGKGADVTATLAFEPPTLVRWSRFDTSGKTNFITAFYCSPAGVCTFFSLQVECAEVSVRKCFLASAWTLIRCLLQIYEWSKQFKRILLLAKCIM